jgi:hypothetical protein
VQLLNLPAFASELQGQLRGVVPHTAGGGRAVLVARGTYLPPPKWEWVRALEAQVAERNGTGSGARERRTAGQVYKRLSASVDAVAAFSEGAAA